jgi:hypothetical protein
MTDEEYINQTIEKMQGVEGFDADAFKANHEAQVAGMKAKNSQLMGSLKKTKDEFSAFQKRFEGIDLDSISQMQEDYNAMKEKTDLEMEENAKKNNDYTGMLKREQEKLIKAQKKWEEEKNNLTNALDSKTKKYHNYLIDLSLTKTLKSVHVGDKYLPFVKSTFLGKSIVESDETGNDVVYVRDGNDNIPLKEYISTWAEDDEAKPVIVPPSNSGGGAGGSSATGVSRKQQVQNMIQDAQAKGDGKAMNRLMSELEKLQ